MASKMDKLRELKADNILTEEEMESVAGGGQPAYGTWGADSRFLNVLLGGDVIDRWGDGYANEIGNKNKIIDAWARVGVTKTSSMQGGHQFFVHNRGTIREASGYYINGQQVSAQQAYAHAMKVTGKYLPPASWNW